MNKHLVAIVMLSAVMTGTAVADDNWIVKQSGSGVEQTVDRLVASVEKAGAKVFARVDHAAGASSVGTELPPTVMVMFGNPKIGTPLIAANRRVGLDLPIRVLVWEEDGVTQVGYEDPGSLAQRYGLTGVDGALQAMGKALDGLTTKATQ